MRFREWREVEIGEICSVKGGKRLPKGKDLIKDKNTHPYIRIRDMYQVKNLELNDEFEYVDDETFEKISRYIANTGDVILAIVGNTIGLVSKVGKTLDKASLTENCVKLIDLKGCISDFLYYHFISQNGQNEIKKGIVGTSQPKLPIYNIQKISIKLPTLPEQKAIAATLSCLDDKIELNNRMNKNLEEMAQAIFKSWFVDFEPFQEGEFEESELGMIPKGWRVGTLGELLDNIKESEKAGDHLNNSYYVPIDCLPMRCLGLSELKPGKEAQSSLIKFKKNDILIGAMRVYFHRVTLAPIDGITRTTCFVLRPKQDFMLMYLLLACNLDSSIEYANKTSKGSTMPYAIWEGGLKNLKLVIPPEDTSKKFQELVSPLIKQVRDSLFENSNLVNIRDTLLPKLMSGEIRIPITEEV